MRTLLRRQPVSLLDDWDKELFRLPLAILCVSKALADETKRVDQPAVEGRYRISYGWMKSGKRLMNIADFAAVTV